MQHMGLAGRYQASGGRMGPEQLAELKEDLIAGPTKCGFESGMDRSHDQYTSTPSSTEYSSGRPAAPHVLEKGPPKASKVRLQREV